VKMLCVVFVKN